MRRMRRNSSLVGNVLKGAVAGAAATWALDRVTNYMYEHEADPARRREEQVRHGRSAYESAADRIASILGRELSKAERQQLGTLIHWLLGIGAGIAYSVYGRRVPAFRRLGGGGFGSAFWASVDEALVSLLGLTPPPARFPWQAHARGLAGHLAYGITAEQTLRVLDAVA
jgi:Protein of unknown function (DUF1440)